MSRTIKYCVDRVLPTEKEEQAKVIAEGANPNNLVMPENPEDLAEAMALVKHKLWEPGRVLHVRFLDGDSAVQAKVEAVAHEWSSYANIQFIFDNTNDAEIRISFLQPGSWSYIGLDALLILPDQPTMNFGWFDANTTDEEYHRVVLHEFGHALGCIHEHQNPGEGGIPWNEEAVIEAYRGAPNHWTEQQVRVNILNKYDKDLTQFTGFDRASIMLYPVPQEHTIGDFEIPWQNFELSDVDKQFIGEMYPFS